MALEIGRGVIDDDSEFTGQVGGGGSGGPGDVYKYRGYGDCGRIRFDSDNHSGSKRSGTCSSDLETDSLYCLRDVAVNSSRGTTFYVSTFGGVPKWLDEDEFEAEQARIWPLGKQAALDQVAANAKAESARIERETKEAAVREIERAALAEINAERAAEIAKHGQPEGMPTLSGSPKQIAYAVSIREAVVRKSPALAAIMEETTSKFWIENHRSALYR